MARTLFVVRNSSWLQGRQVGRHTSWYRCCRIAVSFVLVDYSLLRTNTYDWGLADSGLHALGDGFDDEQTLAALDPRAHRPLLALASLDGDQTRPLSWQVNGGMSSSPLWRLSSPSSGVNHRPWPAWPS